MRCPRTLWLYVAREILIFGGLGFVGVTTVLVSEQLLERLDDLLTVGISGSETTRVLGYVVAMIATYAVPIAFAFGVTLAVSRLAGNREILAARSCGIGPIASLLPTCAIGLVLAAASGWLLMEIEPTARTDLRQLLSDVALKGTIVQAGRFRGVHDRMLFVEERDDTGLLQHVMIYDRTNEARPYVAFAERGRIDYLDDVGQLSLQLESGQILLDPEAEDPEAVQTVYFEGFTYSFDARSLLRGRYVNRNPDELSYAELDDAILRIDEGRSLAGLRKPGRYHYVLEKHRRLALLWAPLVLGLVALPLGVRASQGARLLPALSCALAVFAYYALLTLGQLLAREEWLDASVAPWIPNALLLATAFLLLHRTERGARE